MPRLAWLCIMMLFALVALRAQPPAPAHTGKAIQLLQERRYAEAAAEFEQALAAAPDDDATRIQYAVCLFTQERNSEARRQFETIARKRGEAPGLNYYLGRLDLRMNQFAPAIRRLEPLAQNPAFPKASFYLGLAYLGTGDDAMALAALEHSALNNPHDSEVHYRLARVYSGEGRPDDASREFRLYRDARESQRLLEEESHACMDALRAKFIEQARGICEKIADPRDPLRMRLLGELYADRGAYAEAVGPLLLAAKLDPGSFDAWHQLGRTLFWLQRYAEALPALQRAAALNPRFFDTLNLLAATFHALGDDPSAFPVLEQAHLLNPADAKVAAAWERMRAAQKDKK